MTPVKQVQVLIVVIQVVGPQPVWAGMKKRPAMGSNVSIDLVG
jgi:hypothetical protein